MASVRSPEIPRRTFVAIIASGLLAASLPAEAQRAAKVPKIGWLTFGGASA